jgi:hypothetical protein
LPQIRSKLQVLSLDEKLSDAVSQAIELTIRESLESWLRVALDTITIWSGASHHTFADVARIVGTVIVAPPVQGAPDGSLLGLATGDAALIQGQGEDWWSFTYDTSLRHLIQNEFQSTFARNTPYNFIERAELAAIQYLDSTLESRVDAAVATNIIATRIK